MKLKNAISGSDEWRKVGDRDEFISTMTEEHATFGRDDFAKCQMFETPRVFKVRGREFKSKGAAGDVQMDLLVDDDVTKTRLVGVQHVPTIEAKCCEESDRQGFWEGCNVSLSRDVLWFREGSRSVKVPWLQRAFRLRSEESR